MAEETETCGNAPCGCAPSNDSDYCSAYCEGVGETVELDCDCGHDSCSGNF